MHPLALTFLTALAPKVVSEVAPLVGRAGNALINVFEHNAKGYGNILHAVADRIRGSAAAPPGPESGLK